MKPLLFTIFLTSIIGLVSCTESNGSIDWNDKDLSWYNYENGISKLKEGNENGLIIIYADWCPTCKQYSKLFRHKSVIDVLKDVTLIRANKDKQPDISDQFNIDGDYIPRTFALDKKGNIIQDLDSNNPKWWYFLPANDPDFLVRFVTQLKQY